MQAVAPQAATEDASSRVVQPRHWTKKHAEAFQDAVAQLEQLTVSLSDRTGVSIAKVREQLFHTAPQRRPETVWNSFIHSLKNYPSKFEQYGVPKKQDGKGWNAYIKEDIKPFWDGMRAGDKGTFKIFQDCIGVAKKTQVASTSVDKAMSNFKKEKRWFVKRVSDLEDNHAIVAVTLLVHPDPRAQPTIVMTEYGKEMLDHAIMQWKQEDTSNELLDRFASAVKSVRPPSYDYVPPQDADKAANANDTDAPTSDSQTLPPTSLSSTATQSPVSSNTSAGESVAFATAPASAASAPASGVSASTADMYPLASANYGPSTTRSTTGTATPAHPSAMSELLAASHAQRVPHVARLFMMFLSQAIHTRGTDGHYAHWLQITYTMTRLPYQNLFTILNSYGMNIEGWPMAAGDLLIDAIAQEGLVPGSMEVFGGGLQDTSHWRETHVLAIAANLFNNVLTVDGPEPATSS
ncbi:hypothetical protein CF326_g4620 [Tilletia indica]|nr:hypothetical protein CF326_g4620 [Tilletia indica]